MSWDLVLGFFPEEMQRLILDNTISDLMINGTTGVFADRNGVVSHIPLANTLTTDMLLAATQQIARKLGQNLSDQNPILNTRLPDGSRVAVVGPPASINGITMTIRKFNRWYSSDELIASGSLPRHVRDTVVGLIGERKNGIISGGTGSGKTTLMKAFLDHIPQEERLILIEQPAELKVLHPNAVRWEAVDAIPGQVAVTPSELLAAALRHRPDRIIMGEIRNECGYDLLQAMNTGHGGTTLSTKPMLCRTSMSFKPTTAPATTPLWCISRAICAASIWWRTTSSPRRKPGVACSASSLIMSMASARYRPDRRPVNWMPSDLAITGRPVKTFVIASCSQARSTCVAVLN